MKLGGIKTLILGFVLIILVSGAVVFLGLDGMGKINDEITKLGHKHWPVADAVMEMRIDFLEKSHAHSMILEGEIEEGAKLWDHAEENFQENLSKLAATKSVPERDIITFETLNQEFNETKDGLIEAYKKPQLQVSDTNKMARIESVMNSSAMKNFDKLINTMEPMFINLEEFVNEKMNNAVGVADVTVAKNTNLLIFSGIASILLILVLSIMITIILKRLINKLISAV